MPRTPTGNPRGRPKGTGRLGEQTRLTVRIPQDLYTRLEAFAEGRSYTRSAPRLAVCVREAIEQYLARPDKRQTQNRTSRSERIKRQTQNSREARVQPGEGDGANISQPIPAQKETEAVRAKGPEEARDTQRQPAAAPQTKAALLAQLRRWQQDEALGPQAIAERLNADQVPTLSGRGHWSRGTVAKLLQHASPEPPRGSEGLRGAPRASEKLS
jgi:predicted DNA-binding protein